MQQEQKTVLIVEDDNDLRNVLVDRLSGWNYQVVQAEDGEKAVDAVLNHKPHLVLLDLLLPKLDGFQVLEAVRKNPSKEIADTRILVLSNLWSDKDILQAKALKVDEYFVKANTNLEDVFEKIRTLLAAPKPDTAQA